ncbi:hypothetical protein FWH09_02630 [Candidatus Saccharibacteria bacterium]|nr:hypothetical protein [Candidatus Saccharibacteria bacterium]
MRQIWWIGWGLAFAGFVILDSLRLAGVGNDVMDQVSSIIKFLSIASILLYALIYRRHNSLLVIAISLTLLADTMLFWTNQLEWGVFVFCFAQIFHTFRLVRVKSVFLLGYGLALLAVFVWLVTNNVEAIYALAFIYGSLLLLNVFLSWQYRWVTFLGFAFFLACDVNVGLSFLAGNGSLPYGVAPIAGFLVFIFYMPSQALLVSGNDHITPEEVGKASNSLFR